MSFFCHWEHPMQTFNRRSRSWEFIIAEWTGTLIKVMDFSKFEYWKHLL